MLTIVHGVLVPPRFDPTGVPRARGEEAIVRIPNVVCGLLWLLGASPLGAIELRQSPVDDLRATMVLTASCELGGGVRFVHRGGGHDRAVRDRTQDALDGQDGPQTPSGAEPAAAVRSMFEAFRQRSAVGYVAWMTEDFAFDSDDPDFVAAFPTGMSRADELTFAGNLFRDGGDRLADASRAHAVGVTIEIGPIVALPADDHPGQVRAAVERLQVRITLSDGTSIELGGTRAEIDLVLTEAGWRVRRWHERHGPPAGDDSNTTRAAHEGRSDSTGTAEPAPSAVDAPPPLRLALAAPTDRARPSPVFDVTLPREGAVLEVFDVMGRRIARWDLSALPPGHHLVGGGGPRYRAGIYWARLRQSDEAITRRMVWAP